MSILRSEERWREKGQDNLKERLRPYALLTLALPTETSSRKLPCLSVMTQRRVHPGVPFFRRTENVGQEVREEDSASAH